MGALDQFLVTDRVAIVTGAGRGIGAAIAKTYAEAGGDVVLSARTEAQLQEVAGEIEAMGRRAVLVPADLNDTENLGVLVERAVAEFARRHGGQQRRRHHAPALPRHVRALFEAALHFNVTTAFTLTKAATRTCSERLRQRGEHLVDDGATRRPAAWSPGTAKGPSHDPPPGLRPRPQGAGQRHGKARRRRPPSKWSSRTRPSSARWWRRPHCAASVTRSTSPSGRCGWRRRRGASSPAR